MNRLKPHSFTACSRHPTERVPGFCALCLHERLAVLDTAANWNNNNAQASSCQSQQPQPPLRRCKTYSCKRRNGLLTTRSFEPQRKSCDVRVTRNSLSSLFTLDDHDGVINNGRCNVIDFNAETKNVVVVDTVLETGEDEIDSDIGDVDEIRFFEDGSGIRDFDESVELKTVKEFIDLERQITKQSSSTRDLKGIAGSIFVAASVFSKKLHKWRRKEMPKRKRINRNDDVGGLVDMEEVRNVNVGHFRETQSQIGDYGFGRRSCDTDGGRMSLDHPRYSFDEPRASWDGYMIGRALPRPAPMISVNEDVDNVVKGNENLLSEERECSPGGSAQTRDYYTDPSNRRIKSFVQLGLYRKSGVIFDEMKSISNAKVSPTTVELFHGAKLLIAERDMNTNSQKDDSLERDRHTKNADFVVADSGNVKGFTRYLGRNKVWSILGLLHKQGGKSKSDVGGASLTDFTSKAASGDKTIGSSSSVSSTSSSKGIPVQTMRSTADIRGHGNKRSEHHVLERNRSARYSPNNLDNGLLRFYLTPLRSSRTRCGQSMLKNSHSIARNFLRF